MSLFVDIAHDFGDFKLDVAFEAPQGVTALFGRSGSGKTSTIRAIAGIFTPDRGTITVNERVLLRREDKTNLPAFRRRIGYVFQDARLFPHLTVYKNLTYAKRYIKNSAVPLDHIIAILGLEELLSRMPSTLSGGEKQRVAIGRALLANPELLLMDEPLASLDHARKTEILPYLERLRDETRLPILYVSHSISEVARLATQIVIIDHGKIVLSGPIEEVMSDPNAIEYLGVSDAGSILNGHIVKHHQDGLTEIALGAVSLYVPEHRGEVGNAIRLRIDASDVIIATEKPHNISALNILPCKVSAIRYGHGPGVTVRLDIGTNHILARLTQRSASALNLQETMDCYAIIKSVSVAKVDIGSKKR